MAQKMLRDLLVFVCIVLVGLVILGQVGESLAPRPEAQPQVQAQAAQPSGDATIIVFAFGAGVLFMAGAVLALTLHNGKQIKHEVEKPYRPQQPVMPDPRQPSTPLGQPVRPSTRRKK